MEKAKYTLRVDSDILKEMKIFAIQHGKPLNDILVEAFEAFKCVLSDENKQNDIMEASDIKSKYNLLSDNGKQNVNDYIGSFFCNKLNGIKMIDLVYYMPVKDEISSLIDEKLKDEKRQKDLKKFSEVFKKWN